VAATLAAVLMGLWQLDVWQAQRDAEARDLSSLTPVPLAEVLAPDDPFPGSAVGRPVELGGEWLPESTFYVTDRTLEDRDGLWVVTPLAVCQPTEDCGSASALLVVRGWTADPAEAPAPPQGRVDLTGWLQPPEGSGRPDPDPADDLLPEVRIGDAIQRVDQDLYGAYLVAEDVQPGAAVRGLEPVTPESLPEPNSDTGLRNLLYGLQWWVFAGFALFVWWRWVRDEIVRARSEETVAAPAQPDRETV